MSESKPSILGATLGQIVVGVVVGVVVLLGQYLIQPAIAERVLGRETRLKDKFTTYSKSVELASRYFASRTWVGPGLLKDYDVRYFDKDERVIFEDSIRYVHSKLALLSEDATIAKAFQDFFQDSIVNKVRPAVYFSNYIDLLRNELGLENITSDTFNFEFIIRIPYEEKGG